MAEDTQQQMQVVVTELGKAAQLVAVNPGATVADALNAAGMAAPKQAALRLNNTETGMDAVLQPGDVVAIVPQIRGGA